MRDKKLVQRIATSEAKLRERLNKYKKLNVADEIETFLYLIQR